MARIRTDDKMYATVCENLETADQLLRKIGDLQLAIHDEEAICKSVCDEAKEILQKNVAPMNEQIAIHTMALQVFAESHKDAFGKAKSIKLQHGQMGWRLSTVVTIGANTIRLIKKKFKDRIDKFIKTSESVNKKSLKDLTAKELIEIEVFTTTTNPFFAEPAMNKSVDYGQGNAEDK
jgi:phage host-nuclease inhibitor protein Gam